MIIQNSERLSSQTLVDPLVAETASRSSTDSGLSACIDGLIEAQARRSPDAVALVCGDRHLTYRGLDHRANQVANCLRTIGVGPEVLVAICVERSIEMVIGLIGILKAGGAYVPLDPVHPRERLAYMLSDAKPGVLLTQESLRDDLPAHSARTVCLDALIRELPEGESVRPKNESRSSSDLAYVIYTSGSTGQPKGVQIPHRAVVNFLRSMRETPGLDAGDTLLAVTTLSFDIAGLEVFLPLTVGARVVIASREEAADGARLAALMSKHDVTVMQATPATWRMLLEAGWRGSPKLKILCGGEAWSAELAGQLLQRCASLWNMYGPTETTIWSSVCKVGPGKPVVIGPPVANTTFHLFGADSQPVRPGEPGELCIGGDGLARGYLNRPELTAQRFVPDSFSQEPGARLYKTGDLVRFLPDGNIEFLGRIDHQVKIRGFRIEPGEIESVLRENPAIRDAVVMAREDASGETRLVAYLIGANGIEPAQADVRRRIEMKLPRYMMPTAFVTVSSFPLTPNGKLDRKALPAPDWDCVESAESYVAPRNASEETVAGIWRAILGVGRIGVHDDFFALGGHSLLATRVVSRVRDAFGTTGSVRDLFEAPTISEFTKRVIHAHTGEAQDAPPPIEPVSREQTLPLSFSQERLWFLDQLESNRAVYNMPMRIRLGGPLQAAVLRRCLAELARRHESLRTSFESVEGRPVQVIRSGADLEMPVVDLSGMTKDEQEAGVVRLCAEDARRPFDLSRDRTLRATLFRLGEAEHILFLNIHHIVFDDWSMTVLIRECGELYRAFSEGRRSPLPDLTIQYADFAVRQREWLRGAALEKRLDYWRKQLEGAPALLALPADRPRPAVQSYRGATETVVFPEPLLAALKALSQREGVSLFMTLLAAFDVLILRCAGVDDVVVGSPIAGRGQTETEGLIGFFVNTLVLRNDLSGNPTFRELLHRVREVTLDANTHQEVPFERLVEELSPERDLSCNPLCQVVFALQDVAADTQDVGGLSWNLEWVSSGTSKFDLSVTMIPRAAGLDAMAEYSTDLFERETVIRLLTQFRTLLEAVAATPGERIAALPLLTAAGRNQLLVEWNQTWAEYPRTVCVHQLFERQAERAPDAIALVFGDRSLTCRELNRRANQLARSLQEMAVGPGVLVGICVEPSLEMVVGLLGILKAGGGYVPLDPAYPRERLAFMIEDSGMRVLLTQQRVLERLPGHRARVLLLEGDSQPLDEESDRNPASSATAETRAYVIYTSGSTGKPKGVEVAHRSLVNLVTWHQRTYALTPADKATQVASLSFDAAVWELWPCLTAGCSVHIADEAVRTSPGRLVEWIAAQGITICFLPTPLAEAALAEEWPENLPLRAILTGGDRLKLNASREKPLPCALYNHYGPTENTVVTTACIVDPREETPPIGRPIANNAVYIVDQHLHPVPIGVAGELWIGGESLALGYLNRPELTAERFVLNPFGNAPGDRIYRTGDLARYRPDGNIEFLGRGDYQVKIRGFRIEPGEIESALRQHPAVNEALILVREDAPGEKRLVAYVSGRREALITDELRAFLKNTLPDYMVPSAFVVLDALPLTPNGKIDRNALPTPDPAPHNREGEFVPPASPLEEQLARMWSEVMGVANIGVKDNFFALGGHSLMATRLVSRLRDELQIELPLRSIFEDQTVRDLAGRIARTKAAEESKPASLSPPIPRVSRSREMPLSFAQESLWFLDQLAPNSALYNVPLSLRLDGELSAGTLQRCLEEVVRRHEILRTRFAAVEGRPVQIVEPGASLDMPLLDLSFLTVQDREAEAVRLCMEDAGRPFDLTQAPMLRVRLLRLGPTEHVVFLNMHHIVSDGWSLGVLVRELGELYSAFSEGKESPLAELAIQYADFAAWQRDWLRGDVLQAQLGYWKKRLEGAPARLDLPADHPRPSAPTQRGAVETATFPPALVAALKSLGQQNGVSLFMVLLAAFETLLYRYTGEEDIVIGSPLAGRNRRETEGLIGFFVNTVVFRSDLSGDPTFEDLLRQVKEVTLEAFAHQDLPFEKLVEELNPERHPGCNPLCQVLFSLQNAPLEITGLGTLGLRLKEVASGTSKFDLSVSMTELADGLETSVEYSTDLFDAATIRRWLDHYRVLLEGAAANPATRIKCLPLLEEAQRGALVARGSATKTFPPESCIHTMFEQQAARTPETIALTFEGRHLSYVKLDAAASQLARHLQALGVKPGDLVAVCLDRSIEQMTAILAVLKAGGAYVPLDPDSPGARLELILADARPGVLLTQEKLLQKATGAGVAFCLDRDWDSIASLDTAPLPAAVTPASPAYVIYTSGSTGVPKGVVVTHYNVLRLFQSTAQWFAFDANDVWTLFHSSAFDFSVWEMWGALCHGGRLVIVPYLVSRNPGRFYELLATEKVTVLNQTPLAFQQLIHVENNPAARRALNLRHVIFGGEALEFAALRPWFERHGDTTPRLVNMYGITETTVHVTYRPITAADLADNKGSRIGCAIPDLDLFILDPSLSPCPVGVSGELHVGGAGVARGYLHQPELTAARFIPHPWKRGERLYKSGDLARVTEDGDIEYLGRCDRQVKIRGFRVELGEIESVLLQRPDIRQAVVVPQDSTNEGSRLVAYLVRTDGTAPTEHDVRAFLRQHLPGYMVPSAFAWLNTLPMNHNGKVDRAALPSASGKSAGTDGLRVAPSDWIEAQLIGLWGSVLGAHPDDVRQNFFDLGGHSLMAVRLFAEIERHLGVRLPIATIFQAPTVAELAEVIRQTGQPLTKPVSGMIPLQEKGARRPIFFMPSFGEGEEARAGISIFHYRKLAAHLGEDQPCYGMATIPELRDLQSLAAHCVRMIGTVQEHGPYVLAGFCSDGEVAYAVARHLHSLGEEVALLVVFDGTAPATNVPLIPGFTGGDLRQKLLWIASWFRGGPRNSFERIRGRVRKVIERRAQRNEGKEPYRGTLLLFLSQETLAGSGDPELGWGGFVGSIRVERVPGDHFFLLKESQLPFVAAKLNEYLRRLE